MDEFKECRVIRNEKEEKMRFYNIEEGDFIFVNGEPLKVTCDAHESGDATYNGMLLYAGENENGYFPEDLD